MSVPPAARAARAAASLAPRACARRSGRVMRRMTPSAAAGAPARQAVPLLGAEDARQAMLAACDAAAAEDEGAAATARAFYSSLTGAVTRDGGAMAVPISDHIVIRGDAAFDTAIICQGAVFMLDEHLDRLEASAQAVGLALPEGGRDGVCEALLATAAAGGVHDGCLRYWLSSGPGGFGVARRHGAPGVLYAVVVEPIAKAVRGGVTCAPVPHVTPKPAPFCHAKTTNYLPNVVAYEQGKVAGADYGIFLAPNGDVLEAPTANVALLLPGGELRAPCPPPTATDGVLRGLTQQRVFALLEGDPQAAADAGVAACVYGRVTAEDVALAEEIMLMGGGVHVSPVTRWGGALVGSGEPGRTALALLDLIEHDMREGGPRTAVPYSLYDSLDA